MPKLDNDLHELLGLRIHEVDPSAFGPDVEEIPRIIEAIQHCEDEEACVDVIQKLAEYKEKDIPPDNQDAAASVLLDKLDQMESVRVREFAIRCLGDITSESKYFTDNRIAHHLVRALTSSRSQLCYAAAYAVRRLAEKVKDPNSEFRRRLQEYADVLAGIIARTKKNEARARHNAAWALSLTKFPRDNNVIVETLRQALREKDTFVKCYSAAALDIGPSAKPAAPDLASLLADDHPPTRRYAERALEGMGRWAIPALIKARHEKDLYDCAERVLCKIVHTISCGDNPAEHQEHFFDAAIAHFEKLNNLEEYVQTFATGSIGEHLALLRGLSPSTLCLGTVNELGEQSFDEQSFDVLLLGVDYAGVLACAAAFLRKLNFLIVSVRAFTYNPQYLDVNSADIASRRKYILYFRVRGKNPFASVVKLKDEILGRLQLAHHLLSEREVEKAWEVVTAKDLNRVSFDLQPWRQHSMEVPAEWHKTIEEVMDTDFFKALSDGTRKDIFIHLLRSAMPKTVTEITGETTVVMAAVSRHLAQLRDVGLLEAQRRGKEVRYSARGTEFLRRLTDIVDATKPLIPRSQESDADTAADELHDLRSTTDTDEADSDEVALEVV